MTYHKLRIAWSVAWGVIAVLFCLLWVQSYPTLHRVDIGPRVTSTQGRIYVGEKFKCLGQHLTVSHPVEGLILRVSGIRQSIPDGIGSSISYGCLVLIAGTIAALPWFGSRFSLRTLLIVTTLVAVVLGLAISATSK